MSTDSTGHNKQNWDIKKTVQDVLPHNVDRAVEMLIAMSRDLLYLAHEEAQSLVNLDHKRFAYAQREKESLSQRYAQASEEFRGRLGAFRMADRGLIADLNAIQTELKDLTENNNNMIEDIKHRTNATTQSVLFTAQEMGQCSLSARVSNSNNAYAQVTTTQNYSYKHVHKELL
ncbi:MAG: hypothetical protein KAJ40_08200 [Alphaproteobacteria bacterium]|nr:hypothetical protein [Alphaproteobacteria bacterium]